jgi:hypothetical protein
VKVTLDFKSNAASSAMLASLLTTQAKLKSELADVEQAIEQLQKLPDVSLPERTERGNAKHGQTTKAIFEYMIKVAGFYQVPQEKIMEDLKTSPSTTYRSLKALEDWGAIRRTDDGEWVMIPNFQQKGKQPW